MGVQGGNRVQWHSPPGRGGGEGLLVSPVLAGQYVRVVLPVPGPQAGRVVYQRKGEDLVVATFNHTLDAPGPATEQLLMTAVQLVDFGGAVPPNQRLDEEQLANQRGRVLKRPAGRLDGQLEAARVTVKRTRTPGRALTPGPPSP